MFHLGLRNHLNTPLVTSKLNLHTAQAPLSTVLSPTDALETNRGGISAPFSSSKGTACIKGKEKTSNLDDSLPTMLRSSVHPGRGLEDGESSITHIMVVDHLADIL